MVLASVTWYGQSGFRLAAGDSRPQRGKAWPLLDAASADDPATERAASAPTAGTA